jgi:hypothetical protein
MANPFSQFNKNCIPSVSSIVAGFGFVLFCFVPFNAQALEKYGCPLPSMKQSSEGIQKAESPLLSGYFLASVFPVYPSYFCKTR